MLSTVGPQLEDLAVLKVGESQAMGACQEQVQHRPAQAQTTGLTREPTNDFGPTANLLQGTFREIRRSQPLAQTGQVLEVDTQRWQIIGQAGRGAGVLPLQVRDELAQPLLSVGRIARLVEDRPVRTLDLLMQTGPIRQFGDHIPQLVNGAPAPVGLGPQLFDGLDQTRCTVADDQPGRAESAAGEVPTQIEPVLVRFTLAETDRDQHPFPQGGVAPSHQHSLLVTARPGGQIHCIEEQYEQADLGQTLAAERAVAVAQLAADAADGGLRDLAQPGLHGQALINASRGRVRTTAFVSGMTRLTNCSAVLRTWGMAMVISPSAVWIGFGRVPLREPVAARVRSYRARL